MVNTELNITFFSQHRNLIIVIGILVYLLIQLTSRMKFNPVVALFTIGLILPSEGFILLCVYGLFYLLVRKSSIKIVFSVLLIFFFLYLFITNYWLYYSTQGLESLESVFDILVGMLVAIIVASVIKTEELYRNVFDQIFRFSLLINMIAIVEFSTNWLSTHTIMRVSSVFTNPITFSVYAGIMLLYGISKKSRGDFSKWDSLLLLLNSVNIIMTMSRAVWFALVFVGFVYFIRSAVSKKMKLLALALFLPLLFLVIAPNELLTSLLDRLFTAFDLSDPSTNYRYLLLIATGQIIRDNLLFGVGFSSFQHEILKYNPMLYSTKITHPHNTYLELLATVGLVGSVLMLTLIVYSVNRYHRKRYTYPQHFREFLFNTGMFFLFFGLFDRILTSFYTAIFFWCWLGLMNITFRNKEGRI
ncbi:O-antigen ligase family protein [Enterococcus sp. BWR-S5]|uniref:O-antigen ligase family protein n=1 Tax=Enterococcus sp. BWR-S5 TaxID=2787714 RepID=UPI0019221E6A|nr:O-antigen ligase family protein [Enterococcus sp. BWR-S5]MBL1224734.1 O-antigen ligase family protein [Enterococcus sp. BWR-S5]